MAYKELTVMEWTEEIERGLEYRKAYGLEKEWKSLEAMFYATHPSSMDGPALIYSSGDALMSQLCVPNPQILLKSRKYQKRLSATIVEAIDNDFLVDLDIVDHVSTSLLHAFLWGVGILKIGYDSEYGWDPKLDVGKDSPLGLSLSQFDSKGRRIEFSDGHPGMPWVRSVLPHDIVVPYGTFGIENAPWVAHRIIRHIEDIKADKKYKNTSSLEPVMSMKDYTKSYQAEVKPYKIGHSTSTNSKYGSERSEFVELWEIHDKRTGKVFVIATGHDKFLRDSVDRLQLKIGLPFVDFRMVPRARTFWVTPDAYLLKHHQAELSDIALQQTKQRRISVLKFLAAEDAMDESERQKVLSADVGVMAIVNSGMPLKEAVMAMTPGNNNQYLSMDAEAERRSAREVLGFSRNQMGEFEASGRRTAREAMLVDKGSGIRMSRRQKIIRDTHIRIMRKLNEIVFAFWTAPKWIEVGPHNSPRWLEYVGEDLKGDYKYDLTFSAEGSMTLASRKQEAMQLYMMLSQDPMVNQPQLREFIKGAFNDVDMDVLFSPGGGGENAPVSPQMSQMQQQGGASPSGGQAKQSPKM